jgi:hypothetical protein
MTLLIDLLNRVRKMYSGYGLIGHLTADTDGLPQWKGETPGTLMAAIDDALRTYDNGHTGPVAHSGGSALLAAPEYEENERLKSAAADGHCRKCLCDDCARFYREIDRT